MNRNVTQARSSMSTLLLLLGQLLVAQQVLGSGIFELNLSALIDAYGRDLRLDCCAWQNASQRHHNHQQQLAANNLLNHHQHGYQSAVGALSKHQQPQSQQHQLQDKCDPTKCQLIVRICVKNYQTQIEASQCTFGELTAQVLKPNAGSANSPQEAHSAPSGASMTSLGRLQQQQQLAALQKMKLSAGSSSSSSNIHHQRMLMQMQQQQHMAPFMMTTHEQHSRLYHQARALRQVAFDQPISFPFNFTWPGAFSLVLDAWYESPTGLQQLGPQVGLGSLPARQPLQSLWHNEPTAGYESLLNRMRPEPSTSYDLYKKQSIIQHSMHGWLTVKNEWTNGVHKTDAATLAYSYRVTCQPNYFGEQCNILCRPRDDVYGHFTCSQEGEIVCLPGWQGKYCEEPICTPGCVRDQGNCTRPNECNCRFGWQGAACEQCVRYPGCVHGTCNKPHDCNCEPGWGGLLCNEDLNYCTNHQPCKNGATCLNTFDAQTGEGSYTCACEKGFAGRNCEKRLAGANAAPWPTNSTQSSSKADQQQQLAANSINLNQATSNTHSNQQHNNETTIVRSSTASSYQQQQSQQQQQARPASLSKSRATSALVDYPANILGALPVQEQASSLDHRVMVAYGVIIVCMVILVVLLVLRLFFERLSGAVVGCGQRLVAGGSWPSMTGAEHPSSHSRHHSRRHRRSANPVYGHHHHHHHASTRSLAGHSHEQDVATLQNQQNIYKSRSSLSTEKLPFGAASSQANLDDTCSSSASSIISSADEHLGAPQRHRHGAHRYHSGAHLAAALQHQQAAAQYASHSAHYAPYAHYHHMAAAAAAAASNPHMLSASQGAHLSAAHSVHNLTSAAYGRLNQHLSQQPPPPPYTISSAVSHPNSIYQPAGSQHQPAPAYAGTASLYGQRAAPPSTHYNAQLYANSGANSTYGTAATLAAHHALSSLSSGAVYGHSLASGYGALPGQPQAPATTKNHKSAASKAQEAAAAATQEMPVQLNGSDSNSSAAAAASTSQRLNEEREQQDDHSAAYGNLTQQQQQAHDDGDDAHNDDHANASTNSTETTQQQQQQQQQSSSSQQSPYYFILCNHI